MKTDGARRVFTASCATDRKAEVEILVDGGPLCVGPVWDWENGKKVEGLYFVYHKKTGLSFGPFYAEIHLADRDMRKALKAFPQPAFWEQPLEWFRRQTAFAEWIEKNMGSRKMLIGGRWAPDP